VSFVLSSDPLPPFILPGPDLPFCSVNLHDYDSGWGGFVFLGGWVLGWLRGGGAWVGNVVLFRGVGLCFAWCVFWGVGPGLVGGGWGVGGFFGCFVVGVLGWGWWGRGGWLLAGLGGGLVVWGGVEVLPPSICLSQSASVSGSRVINPAGP